MVRVREVIVVEGRYDKNTLSQVVDATILETRGFGVMKDKALLSLLRQAADHCKALFVFEYSKSIGFYDMIAKVQEELDAYLAKQ